MQKTSLSPVDAKRLDEVLQLLDKHDVRFRVAETVKRTGESKGNVSNILNGNIPMSENFYLKFKKAFNAPEQTEVKSELNDKFSQVIEKLINQQATLNVLKVIAASNAAAVTPGKEAALISSEIERAIDAESDRLYDVFSKKGKF